MTCRRERTLGFASAASILLTLSACEEAAPAAPPLERARNELAAADGLGADVILQHELDAGVPRSELAALLGEAALLRGDLRAARTWLIPAEFSDATASLGFRMLGRLKMAEGDLAAAGKAFDRALATGSRDPELWVDIGRLRYRGGEHQQALDAAARALQLGPRNAAALQFHGQLLRDTEGPVGALPFFSRAIELQPDDIDLQNDYAATLGDAGRAGDALAVLRAGNASAETSKRGLFLQAVIAARGGEALLARELLQRSGMDDEGSPAALLLSGIVHIEEENFASAAQQLDRLYRRQPDNPRAAELLAFALSRSGAERELVNRFAGIAASPRGSPYLRTLVGRAHETLGERNAASHFLDLAAVGMPTLAPIPSVLPREAELDDQTTEGREVRNLVRDAIAGGHASDAVRHARKFAGRNPGSGDGYALLGDAEFANGDRKKAREAYERSARIRRSWSLTLRLARAHEDPKKAFALLETYVRRNPLNGDAAVSLANFYASKNQWAQAAVLLDQALVRGMGRVPGVLAARSLVAAQLGDSDGALAWAYDAHELQPMNPTAIGALIAALPKEEVGIRLDLEHKMRSLTAR